MVERARRQKGKQQLLGNHQKCWIWGRNVVLETLRAGRWPILELRLASDRLSSGQIAEAREWAARDETPVVVESAEVLRKLCRTSEHQGYAAKMPPFPYDDWKTLSACDELQPLYLILDAIQDPYNFGAILRSAAVMNVQAVFVPQRGQSEVTSLVARTSAGAVNHLPLAQVPNLASLVERFQEQGVAVLAASEQGKRQLFAYDFRRPTAVIFGNEGTGISQSLLEQCDEVVCIPQTGTVDSLNAAVAAGIVLYEAARQRHTGEQPAD